MNSLIPLLAIGFDFGESVPYLLGGGAGAGALAFLPKILEKFKKNDSDGTKPDSKPDTESIINMVLAKILEKLGKDGGIIPDNGGNKPDGDHSMIGEFIKSNEKFDKVKKLNVYADIDGRQKPFVINYTRTDVEPTPAKDGVPA